MNFMFAIDVIYLCCDKDIIISFYLTTKEKHKHCLSLKHRERCELMVLIISKISLSCILYFRFRLQPISLKIISYNFERAKIEKMFTRDFKSTHFVYFMVESSLLIFIKRPLIHHCSLCSI